MPPASQPFQPSISGTRIASSPWTSERRLVRFEAEPNQLVLTTYDLVGGSKLDEKITPLKDMIGDLYPAPSVFGGYGDEMYFVMNSKIFVLDVVSGQLMMKYP